MRGGRLAWIGCGVVLAAASARGQTASDACASAPVLQSGIGGFANLVSATLDGPSSAPCGGPSAARDVWFKIVPVRAGTGTISVISSPGLGQWHFAQLFGGTCGSLGPALACDARTGITNVTWTIPVTGTDTYLVRLGLQGVVDTAVSFTVTYTDPPVGPMPTAFTYQGMVTSAGVPLNAPADLTFKLFDTSSLGLQVGPTVTRSGVPLSGGLFSTSVDFGASAFEGHERWLEVTANGQVLAPRQAVTPAPYALYSLSAASAGTAGSASTAGYATSAGNGGSGGVSVNNWIVTSMPSVTYNSGTFSALSGSVVTVSNLPAGTAVLTWSMSGYTGSAGSGIEVRPNVGGTTATPIRWFFNPTLTHLSNSGSFSTHVAGGSTTIQLEVRAVTGSFTTDTNDSMTMTLTVYKD